MPIILGGDLNINVRSPENVWLMDMMREKFGLELASDPPTFNNTWAFSL